MWHNIDSEQDLTAFMERVFDFHDSCVKELKYISGAYVDKNPSMYPVNYLRCLKMIVQRQYDDLSAIELEFSKLKYLKLHPCDEQYTCELLDVTMLLNDGDGYWCDCGGLPVREMDHYSGTVICASKARWRDANAYIGPQEVYKTT